MRKKIKIFNSIISIPVIMILALLTYGELTIPNEFIVPENTSLRIGEFFFVSELSSAEAPQSKKEQAVNLLANNGEDTQYLAKVKLFGAIPVKDARITVSQRRYVVPSGEVFGLRMYTDGLIVVGTDKIDTNSGNLSPAELCGIKAGDIIKRVNGKNVARISEFTDMVEKSGGDALEIELVRGGETMKLNLLPVSAPYDDKLKAGLWLRDSSAGIGTLTFYDKDTGVFAGLGHAVCDVDTTNIIPLSGGDALTAVINGCYKGSNGSTGELCGVFGDKVIGSLMVNGNSGVYGMLSSYDRNAKALPVATRQEVKLGPAQIISTVDDGGPQYYDIEIIKINIAADSNERNMTIEIKDEGLISKTGGIVQGMSGSPIIQDGYFVGAVTHVFLNNCLQGYGIFAENMMKTCDELNGQLKQDAA